MENNSFGRVCLAVHTNHSKLFKDLFSFGQNRRSCDLAFKF